VFGDRFFPAVYFGNRYFAPGAEAAAPVVVQPLTYGAAPLAPAKVRAKYEELDAIDRKIQAKEEAERENVRKQEEAKRQLADLESKKRQTKTIAERKRKLQARIDAYEAEIEELRETIAALLDEIERAKMAFEAEMQLADRRRRMLLMIAAA
jgi:vacuolar-type H+-ATPase subunit I/STV1